jgi:predicted nucleic acid-binding protein
MNWKLVCKLRASLLWIGVGFQSLTHSELTDEERVMAEHLNQTLGRGEAACIALAKSRQWIILTDDRDARRAAREAGLIVSGTLGALMNLVRGKALSLAEADEFLATMKRRGYRCPVNSLSELDTG